MLLRIRFAVAAVVLFLAPGIVSAQGVEYLKENYTKYEHPIPMRDGVRLFTAVYVPKDVSKPYPIMMLRTPYSVRPYGVDNFPKRLGPSQHFSKDGYIFVYQDVRGRYLSEGEYVHVRPHIAAKNGTSDIDESSDTYDTVEWLLKHVPNNNGRVGLWGVSYPGFYAAASLPGEHPAVKAVSPQAPVTDWFVGDDFHHNGAFFLAHAFDFFINFDRIREAPSKESDPAFKYPTPNGYEFHRNLGAAQNTAIDYEKKQLPFWRQMMEHPNNDEFWKSRLILPHLDHVTAAVMTVGGWFDAEDVYGPMKIYETIEKRNPGAENMVVYGPWSHGGWGGAKGDKLGDINFDVKTAKFYQEQIQLPFFRYHLKQEGELDLPDAYLFETGTNRWLRFDSWPPASQTTRLFFSGGGKLDAEAPPAGDGFDEYPSDPSKPVPFVGYTTQKMAKEYMVDDQRFASTRPDVLVYSTGPLEEDFTVAGPFTASLQVSVTGTAADFIVKLIDVYPPDYPNPDPNPKGVTMGGYQQLVRGEPMRGRFRNSFEKPEPFEPGKITKVEFVLPDVLHTFRREHRIMVQIQSTWFPLIDINPQTYVDIYHAKPEDYRKATHRIYRSAAHPSFIEVTKLPR